MAVRRVNKFVLNKAQETQLSSVRDSTRDPKVLALLSRLLSELRVGAQAVIVREGDHSQSTHEPSNPPNTLGKLLKSTGIPFREHPKWERPLEATLDVIRERRAISGAAKARENDIPLLKAMTKDPAVNTALLVKADPNEIKNVLDQLNGTENDIPVIEGIITAFYQAGKSINSPEWNAFNASLTTVILSKKFYFILATYARIYNDEIINGNLRKSTTASHSAAPKSNNHEYRMSILENTMIELSLQPGLSDGFADDILNDFDPLKARQASEQRSKIPGIDSYSHGLLSDASSPHLVVQAVFEYLSATIGKVSMMTRDYSHDPRFKAQMQIIIKPVLWIFKLLGKYQKSLSHTPAHQRAIDIYEILLRSWNAFCGLDPGWIANRLQSKRVATSLNLQDFSTDYWQRVVVPQNAAIHRECAPLIRDLQLQPVRFTAAVEQLSGNLLASRQRTLRASPGQLSDWVKIDVPILSHTGLKAVYFHQEGHTPPSIGVILEFFLFGRWRRYRSELYYDGQSNRFRLDFPRGSFFNVQLGAERSMELLEGIVIEALEDNLCSPAEQKSRTGPRGPSLQGPIKDIPGYARKLEDGTSRRRTAPDEALRDGGVILDTQQTWVRRHTRTIPGAIVSVPGGVSQQGGLSRNTALGNYPDQRVHDAFGI